MRQVYGWLDLIILSYGTPPRPDLSPPTYTPESSIVECTNVANSNDGNNDDADHDDAKQNDANRADVTNDEVDADHDEANHDEVNNNNGDNKHGASDPYVDDNTMVASWLNALEITVQNDPVSVYNHCKSPAFVKWFLDIFRAG